MSGANVPGIAGAFSLARLIMLIDTPAFADWLPFRDWFSCSKSELARRGSQEGDKSCKGKSESVQPYYQSWQERAMAGRWADRGARWRLPISVPDRSEVIASLAVSSRDLLLPYHGPTRHPQLSNS